MSVRRPTLPLHCRAYIVPAAQTPGFRGVARPRWPMPMPKPASPAEPPVPSEEEARERLRAVGLRATPARVAVLREMAAVGSPLSHGELVDRLRRPRTPAEAVRRRTVRPCRGGSTSRPCSAV